MPLPLGSLPWRSALPPPPLHTPFSGCSENSFFFMAPISSCHLSERFIFASYAFCLLRLIFKLLEGKISNMSYFVPSHYLAQYLVGTVLKGAGQVCVYGYNKRIQSQTYCTAVTCNVNILTSFNSHFLCQSNKYPPYFSHQNLVRIDGAVGSVIV